VNMEAMSKRIVVLSIGWLVVAGLGCWRRSASSPPRRPRKPPPPVVLRMPPAPPDPLDEPLKLVLEDVAVPKALELLDSEHGVRVSISPSIPVEEWQGARLCVAMVDGSRRTFLDWFVRPLRAHYSLEADGGVWVSRTEDLLESEPLVLRTYRVPTHLVSAVPLPGALSYHREQAAIIETLETCLRYLLERRPQCTLAFHGQQDVLVARLPARGHRRLVEILRAMRFGTGPIGLVSPTREDLRAKLAKRLEWERRALPAPRFVAEVARRAGINIGCNARDLGAKGIIVEPGEHTVGDLLEAIVRQTPVGRYELEPGHGVWLYREGQKENFPLSGASRWDGAEVRAYEVGRLLPRLPARSLLARLKKQVDPGEWERGLPAAAVFVPTSRLIVVHYPEGQRRVAAVLAEMIRQFGPPAPLPGR